MVLHQGRFLNIWAWKLKAKLSLCKGWIPCSFMENWDKWIDTILFKRGRLIVVNDCFPSFIQDHSAYRKGVVVSQSESGDLMTLFLFPRSHSNNRVAVIVVSIRYRDCWLIFKFLLVLTSTEIFRNLESLILFVKIIQSLDRMDVPSKKKFIDSVMLIFSHWGMC